jgi:DNA-directed RNA polymerase subunit RPC12/RpoP
MTFVYALIALFLIWGVYILIKRGVFSEDEERATADLSYDPLAIDESNHGPIRTEEEAEELDSLEKLERETKDEACPNCGNVVSAAWHHTSQGITFPLSTNFHYRCSTCSAMWHIKENGGGRHLWYFISGHDRREKKCCGTCAHWDRALLPQRDGHDLCKNHTWEPHKTARLEYFDILNHGR